MDTLTDAQRVLQPGAHAYVFTPAGPEHYQTRDALVADGWTHLRTLIWYSGSRRGLGAWRNAYEPVLVLSNGPPRPYPGPNASYPSLLAYPAPPGRTRKPWQLYARFLEMSSTADELAIDPYAGADPLAKAAGRMNRGQPTISGDLYTPQQVADDLANRTWRDAGRLGENENHDRETGTHVQDRLDVRP